ncbi:MAG: RsmE family RNA methyltransferase, partial [Pseudomonadota bacterium]
MTAKIRLYVEQPLGQGQSVQLTREQAHYLFGVMRLGVGDALKLLNGTDGEWRAKVAEAGKRVGMLSVLDQTGPLVMPPDVWLLFAPVKKARTDFIVEKAVEMGVRRIIPVQTAFTNSGRIQRDRLQAHAVEAAEQCGATYVPEIAEMARLDRVLADMTDRPLMF